MVIGSILGSLAESFVDNVCRDKVSPKLGSMVYCDLLKVEHSGIYVGDGNIVHLDGSGDIELVNGDAFLGRLDGWNTAISIYVSSHDGVAVGDPAVAARAMRMLGKSRDYHLLFDNCHQFTSGCMTGDFESVDNYFWLLKRTAANELGASEWRVWER